MTPAVLLVYIVVTLILRISQTADSSVLHDATSDHKNSQMSAEQSPDRLYVFIDGSSQSNSLDSDSDHPDLSQSGAGLAAASSMTTLDDATSSIPITSRFTILRPVKGSPIRRLVLSYVFL